MPVERIASVEALPNHRLKLRFEDGLEGVADVSDMVGRGVFAALVDPAKFGEAFIDPVTHTVAWPGGIDLCPDSLRQEIEAQQKAA